MAVADSYGDQAGNGWIDLPPMASGCKGRLDLAGWGFG